MEHINVNRIVIKINILLMLIEAVLDYVTLEIRDECDIMKIFFYILTLIFSLIVAINL